MKSKHSEYEKKKITHEFMEGRTAKEICSTYNISKSTLYLWRKEFQLDPTTNRTNREIYLLEKELHKLRTENEIYKSSGCVPMSPLSDKLVAIDRLSQQYSIHALCRVLGVLRSTYYHHKRKPQEKSQNALQDQEFKPIIKTIFETSKSRFGAKRIRAKMMAQGYIISDRRIARLMNEMGLAVVKRRYPNATFEREYKYYPNRLKRNFSPPAPNTAWVSDITFVRVKESIYYLCVVIDLFSRKVIGHSISVFIDTDLVSSAFQQAYQMRNSPPELLFHSDQGSQYASYAFRSMLRTYNVTQSFSKPGCPHDNAVAETFFASIKKEEFRLNTYDTISDLETAVDEYIEFYNDYRPHQRLGYKTPNEYEIEKAGSYQTVQ